MGVVLIVFVAATVMIAWNAAAILYNRGDNEPPLGWIPSDLVVINVPHVEPLREPEYEPLHEANIRRRLARESQRQQRRERKREMRRNYNENHRRRPSGGSSDGDDGGDGGDGGDGDIGLSSSERRPFNAYYRSSV